MVEAIELRPIDAFAADVVSWVPLAPQRRGARGFDQAEILAAFVASKLGLDSAPLLTRVRDTTAQATRTGRQRRASLRGAFSPPDRAPPSVLLVDDVLTTGVTAATCAAALRKGGARRVAVLTAARSCRGTLPTRCYGAP
jgi:predicted amidophosphoribosyltransferase